MRREFATVSILPFVLNGITGGYFLGHYKAVKFNYPNKVLEQDPGLVAFNTVNMANAITPDNPKKQMDSLLGVTQGGAEEQRKNRLETDGAEETTTPPLGLWVGGDDELFEAEKVAAFAKDGIVLPGEKHLGIIINAHKWMGPWIVEHMTKNKSSE